MAIVSDSSEASGVINNNNGVIEPDQIPAADAPVNNSNVVDDHDNNINNGGYSSNDQKKELEKKMKKKKKKAGPFSFFRSALVALRSDNKKKSSLTKTTSVVDLNDANWKKIVGSMRPLHLQDDKSPAPSPGRGTWDLVYNHSIHSHLPSSPSSSSVSTLSQYASASNLQALDDGGDEDEDPDVVFDAIRGDEMIDYKAEEFIAQFYQRMKMDKHHHQPHHHRGKSEPF